MKKDAQHGDAAWPPYRGLIGALFGTCLFILALGVRLIRLGHFSYWLDEIMGSYFIHGTWLQFWDSLRFDAVHPPLDYLVARAFENVHPSDAVRKLPDVIWGALSVPVLFHFIRRRAGQVAGAVAGFLLALAPFHVRYSQEFRPYSLGVFLLLLSLFLVDRYLEKPVLLRLICLYLASLAAAYALYLSAVVLAIAALALIAEDCFSPEASRRMAARRALFFSPLFAACLFIAYLPWLPVVREAARRAPVTAPPEMTLARLTRLLAFYSFAPNDGYALGFFGGAYALLAALGVWIAIRRPGLRFVAPWVAGGSAAIEILEHFHPHYFAPRHYLPAAAGVPVLAAIALSSLCRKNLLRIGGAITIVLVIAFCDARALAVYFRQGRPDWRPLANYLRRQPADERILTENQYAQLCVAYYLVGPDWLHGPEPKSRSIITLQGDTKPIAWLWEPGKSAWLVLLNGGQQSDALKRWADPYPSISFPSAEGGAILKHLSRRTRAGRVY